MKRVPLHIEPVSDLGLPTGPPLHLERPGASTRHLSPFVLPERLERLREVLGRRTRHLTALLEHVHDPHNIAACIRSCDALGIQDLHLVPQPDQRARVSRMVSRGAHRWITLHRHPDTQTALAALRGSGYRIAATDLGEGPPPTPVAELSLVEPLCLAFGNERDGISPQLRAEADLLTRIPMLGFVESLNISVAFAVALSGLRARLDHLEPPVAGLDAVESQALLDRWIATDIPRARAVLDELARRETRREPG